MNGESETTKSCKYFTLFLLDNMKRKKQINIENEETVKNEIKLH